jgi:hypothetical protein
MLDADDEMLQEVQFRSGPLHHTRHMRCPQGTSCAELPSNVCTEVLQLQSRRTLRFSSTSSVRALRFMQV